MKTFNTGLLRLESGHERLPIQFFVESSPEDTWATKSKESLVLPINHFWSIIVPDLYEAFVCIVKLRQIDTFHLEAMSTIYSAHSMIELAYIGIVTIVSSIAWFFSYSSLSLVLRTSWRKMAIEATNENNLSTSRWRCVECCKNTRDAELLLIQWLLVFAIASLKTCIKLCLRVDTRWSVDRSFILFLERYTGARKI